MTLLCDIVPCGKPAKRGPNGRTNGMGMCSMHLERNRRHGSPYAVFAVTLGCGVADCREAHYAKGWCNKHYSRMYRNGTMELSILEKGAPNPCYDTMHTRVKRAFGSARTHDCVDCGKQAQHWSYNHSGETELQGPGVGDAAKYIFTYGTSIEDYSPRCAPCHKKFDLEAVA